MHSSSSSLSSLLPFSLGSLVQYAFLGFVVYILAGAPLLSLFNLQGSSSLYSSYSTDTSSSTSAIAAYKLDSLVIPQANLNCEEHRYKGVYVLSREPLVVYIEGFLSDEECNGVVRVR